MSLHWGGRGFGHRSRLAKAVGATPTPSPTLSAPDVTLTSNPGANPTVDIGLKSDHYANDFLDVQRSATADYAILTMDISYQITMDDLSDGISNAELVTEGYTNPTGGAYYQRYRIRNGVPLSSAWVGFTGDSNLDETPDAPAFVDVTGASTSTQYTSNTITVAGLDAGLVYGVPVTITGGEYRKNGGSWVSTPTTALNGDTFQLRLTSSASNLTQVNAVLDINGVTDTYSVTTIAASINPPAGSVLLLAAKDTSTLFQSNAGATAVAADGDPVGYWGDQSGAGFHMTAVANDTTRPTYKLVSGKPFVRADGSNDYLRRAASLGSYAAGAATFGFAIVANPATNCTLFGIGSSGGNNPTYYLMSNNGTATRASAQIRNDLGTSTFAPSNNLGSAAFNNTARRLIFVDNGSQITLYIDGVAQTPVAYTRSGALTLNLTALFAWARATPINFFACDLAGMVAYNSALAGSDLTDLDTYLASLL